MVSTARNPQQFYLNQQRWAERWFVMKSRATIRVPASTDLVVEGTIDLIFFSAVDTCQMFRHFAYSDSAAEN